MAAYDNVSLPAPPNIATAGNYAQMLMQGLSQLPQQYYAGQEQQYKLRNQNLFQNPDNRDLLTNATGNTDYGRMLSKIVEAGGGQVGAQLLPTMQRQPFLDEKLREYKEANAGVGQPTNNGPASSTAAASPASLGAPQSSGSSGGAQPHLSSRGTDNEGADSVRSIATGIAGGRDVPPQVMQRYAQALGLSDPDQPLSDADAARARLIIGNNLKGGQQAAPQPGQPAPQQAGAPPPPGAAPAGAPPQAAPQQAPQPPAANFNDRFSAAYGGAPPAQAAPAAGGAANMVPPGVNPLNYAMALKKQADATRKRADAESAFGFPSKANEDRAASLDKQADAILEQLGKGGELTNEEKNARASGVPGPLAYKQREKQQELKATHFDALDKGIQAQDSAAKDNDDDIRAMRGILNDPNLFTGPGHEFVDSLRGLMINAHLMDPNERLPNDALKKITSRSLQAQMTQMRDDAAEIGGSAGRTMLAQIKIMQDASQNPDMSKPGLRYLTELMDRTNQRAHDIAQLARTYKRAHGGVLDDGFYDERAKYNATHSLITDQEMEHHELLAAPSLPPSLLKAPKGPDSDAAVAKWAESQGLKRGDPIRVIVPGSLSPTYKPVP